MNIAIEAFSLSLDKITGIGNVALNYLRELEKHDGDNHYYIYTMDGLLHYTISNPRWKHVDYDSRVKRALNHYSRLLVRIRSGKKDRPLPPARLYIRTAKMVLEGINNIYFSYWLASSLRKNRIDVYLGIFASYFPLYFLSRLKKIWLIHDLVWKLFPETTKINNRMMSFRIVLGMRKADLLLSVSDSTKDDVIRILKIRTPITTVHNAADRLKFFPADKNSIARVKKKYGIKKKYILSVCTIEPRKNLISLLKAYEMMADNERYHLVLVGMSGWKNTPLFGMMEKYAGTDRVIMTGYVPEEDLAPLYSGAEVFVFPTLYEGFGLPVLEAMQCGCPVISSATPAISEVAGDACVLVKPLEVEGLASEIGKLIHDQARRKSMSEKGIARANFFSWEKTALRLIEIFRSQRP